MRRIIRNSPDHLAPWSSDYMTMGEYLTQVRPVMKAKQLLKMLEIFVLRKEVSTERLAEELGVSSRTIMRLRQTAEEFDVRFGWVQEPVVGNVGQWCIEDWGVFSRNSVLSHMKETTR